jgi:hypothetical protein
MNHRLSILGMLIGVAACLAPHRALADEPCCDEAHGFHRSGPLYLGMPVDLDTERRSPGRHGILVAVDGADLLLSACRRQGEVWIAGSDRPQVCHGVIKGDALAMLDIGPSSAASSSDRFMLPTVLSISKFAMSKAAFTNAPSADAVAVRTQEPSLPPDTAIEVLAIGQEHPPLYLASTRQLKDGSGDIDCATTARTVFARNQGRMSRVGELPNEPTAVVNADRQYLIVPVDCGKRVGIWAVGVELEQVGYLDNGYEYGG